MVDLYNLGSEDGSGDDVLWVAIRRGNRWMNVQIRVIDVGVLIDARPMQSGHVGPDIIGSMWQYFPDPEGAA